MSSPSFSTPANSSHPAPPPIVNSALKWSIQVLFTDYSKAFDHVEHSVAVQKKSKSTSTVYALPFVLRNGRITTRTDWRVRRDVVLTGDWYVGSRLLKLHASESHLLIGDGGRLVDTLAVNGRRLEDRQNTPGCRQTVRRLVHTQIHTGLLTSLADDATSKQIKFNEPVKHFIFFRENYFAARINDTLTMTTFWP